MGERAQRRERLHELIDLARVCRGWNRSELARALGRDRTRLHPDTDNPRFDFLVALADALEWPLDVVAEYLWLGLSPERPKVDADGDFEAVFQKQRAMHLAGNYVDALDLARHLHTLATSPEQHALAWNRESLVWGSMGRYTRSLDAIRRALRESPISTDRRLIIRSNLANAYYDLWELDSAHGISNSLLEWFTEHPPISLMSHETQAFSYYVRGSSLRRFARIEPEIRVHAVRAESDLEAAAALYEDLASKYNRPDCGGVAHTCRGGLIELAVMLNRQQPMDALATIAAELGTATDLGNLADGEWVESFGWWCIFGANIALHHTGGRELQQTIAVFLNKLLEVAEFKGNWAFRERALTIEHEARAKLSDESGLEIETTVDDEDIRLIAGTMGRFPRFRPVGWQILRTAKVVRDARNN